MLFGIVSFLARNMFAFFLACFANTVEHPKIDLV